MSWLETLFSVPVLEMLGVWVAVGLAALSLVITFGRLVKSEGEIRRLQREVVVFSEASTRVANALDQLLLGNVTTTRAGHTSRRYLLSEAQAGLESGEALDALADRLSLSHDEVRLLQRAQRTLRGAGTPKAA